MASRRVFTLTQADREQLENRVNSRIVEKRVAQRARIILLYAQGHTKVEIARMVGLSYPPVLDWIARFEDKGIAGLDSQPRSGRPTTYRSSQVRKIVTTVCRKPPRHYSRWTVRTLAKHLGLDKDKVHRVLTQHQLHPHRLRTFTFSPDPQFRDKLLDVVGLYMSPPRNAVVLCVDEKTGIQALDRTQPLLPLRSKKPRAWTNEYVRCGTRTLLAAMEVNTGKVTCWVNKTRKKADFIYFLNRVVKDYPDKPLHLVMDNLNIHKNKEVRSWLTEHPHVQIHYTPTHASWVNMIEGFFSILTKRGLQQSVHRSAKALEQFLYRFVQDYNKACGPFIWKKNGDKLEKIIELTEQYQQE